jgi:protein involved in polysaccharide export with SLBB domain
MSLRKIYFILFILAGITLSVPSLAQEKPKVDYSTIRVDDLSDSQIRQLVAQLNSAGVVESKIESTVISKGMRPEEASKLTARVLRIRKKKILDDGQENTNKDNKPTDSLLVKTDTIDLVDEALSRLKSKIFGADIFKRKNASTFQPNVRLATPPNYQIGTDDELLIDIYGYSEVSHTRKVSTDGKINVPLVGVITVGGMSVEQATARIRNRLSTIYPGIKSGNTKVRIGIGNIRTINIILTGDLVRPGTYALSSVSSVYNALYESGGPTENGSFRQIEIIRGGTKIATVDLYDFLLNGEFKDNVRLQDNDVIRVPTYQKRVEIVGEVKTPGYFELTEGETLADLIAFTGGFTERAFKTRLMAIVNTDIERRILDIPVSEIKSYKPKSGDKFFIDEILDRYENRVTIEGAVFRPGVYELDKGLTLSKLIKRAEGLKEDAFQNRGYILRLRDDLQTEIVSFDLAKIISGQSADIMLRREDVVTIASIMDLKDEYFIRVEGEIRIPGRLKYSEGMTVEDAILLAGGLKETATTQRIEVSRPIRNSNALSASAQIAQVFQLSANSDLKLSTAGFVLKPFDIIVVRLAEGYQTQRLVRIDGEVLYPGIYALTKKDDRISDVIKRAGGFTASAYTKGASLRRTGSFGDSTQIKKDLKRATSVIRDSISQNQDTEVNQNDFVGINMPKIVNEPGSLEDIFLEGGDVLFIPKQLQTVKISGEVLSPVTVVYYKNAGFKNYIKQAGGFGEKARKKQSYVKYANGKVKSAGKFLFFSFYPSLDPGSEIFVPTGQPRKQISLTEIIGVSSSLITLYLLINSLN